MSRERVLSWELRQDDETSGAPQLQASHAALRVRVCA